MHRMANISNLSATTAEAPPPPHLGDGDLPFESPPRRFARARNAVRRIRRKREKLPSAMAVSACALVYALGAAGVGYFGTGLLLFAWLMAGPLGLSVYLTLDADGSLLNPYTLLFSAVVSGSIVMDII